MTKNSKESIHSRHSENISQGVFPLSNREDVRHTGVVDGQTRGQDEQTADEVRPAPKSKVCTSTDTNKNQRCSTNEDTFGNEEWIKVKCKRSRTNVEKVLFAQTAT